MAEAITFYHNPFSRGRIAHWMLEEVAAPYRVELLDFNKGEHRKPAYLKLNPMGKVPTIVHRGTVVSEAAAICAYLADAFPEARLAPGLDEARRGTYLRWLFFGAGCIDPAISDRLQARPPPARPTQIGYGSYDATIDTLETALAPGPFLLGEDFSAADVYIGSQVGWGLMTKSIEPRPAFQSYMGRCAERPAFKRAMAQHEKFAEVVKPLE